MTTPAPAPSQRIQLADEQRSGSVRFGDVFLAVGVILVCFWLFLGRPYSVLSDVGYQAFSARQYADHYTMVFNSVRLVDPRDLAKDTVTYLNAWAPAWPALFFVAFKAGLSVGKAGRILSLLISLVGALGWLRIIALIGLKGRWRIAGILFSALYCLRVGSITKTGAGDPIIYAVAPWLLAMALPLAISLNAPWRRRLIVRTALFCLFLGGIYWLKYTGIFLSLAILGAVLIEQFRGCLRANAVSCLVVLTIYGVAFGTPVVGLKAYNYSASGSDFIESSARSSPRRDTTRLLQFLSETAYNASPTLFSADGGLEHIAGNEQSARGWLARTPSFFLLLSFFYLMFRRPFTYFRNVTLLSGLIPLVLFPALSFAGGPHFSFAFARCCEPYWILLELQLLWLLSRSPDRCISFDRNTRNVLALATVCQIALFLWTPFFYAKEALKIARTPPYKASAADLWDTDLSRYGTRDIDERVKSLIRRPEDIVVPAVYSNRAFATDTMLEFGGRLLPLNIFFSPLQQTHGRDGANYNSTTPFVSSTPLRVILVAPDPYKRDDFGASTERVMQRFTQVHEWVPGPLDPDRRTWIWTGEIQ